MLDYEWTPVNPHREDYAPYHGSNLEDEDFHGGKSVVFAIPTASLEKKMNGVDIQIHVRKEVSKYFEMDSCQNVGVALVNVDSLFNRIIKELRQRRYLKDYLNGIHKRQPISQSLKGSYEIMDEYNRKTGSSISLYVRLSYLGKSVVTEIETGCDRAFYAQEETNEVYPYQCKELKRSEVESGCWGSGTFLPPLKPSDLACYCNKWDAVDRNDIECKHEDDDDEESRKIYADKEPRNIFQERSSSSSSKAGKKRDSKRNSRNGNAKGKRTSGNAGKGGKDSEKYQSKGKIDENDEVVEDSKKTPEMKDGKSDVVSRKGVKGGDVIKGGEAASIGGKKHRTEKGIHADHMESFKEESESRTRRSSKREKSKRDDGDRGEGGSEKGQFEDRKVDKKDEKKSKRARQQSKRDDGERERVSSGKVQSEDRKIDNKDEKKSRRSRQRLKDQKDTKDHTAPPEAVDDVGTTAVTTPDAEGLKSTEDFEKRMKQLRKRSRGFATVGLADKVYKSCVEASSIPTPPTPELCSTLNYRPEYDPCPPIGNTSLFLPMTCSANIFKETPNQFSYLGPINQTAMQIPIN